MSRCFPFPPPGYERKHRPEDLNLLKEERHKEKKHKKEKKDKEKKRDKAKDKDGGDEKHRDKKDRKEKHKDKKEKHKDKKREKEERGKDKEKSSISEESTVSRKLEEESGSKVHLKGQSEDRRGFKNDVKSPALFHGQNGGKPSQSSQPSKVIDDSKFVQELDRRIRDDENGRGSQLPQKVPGVDKRDQGVVARPAVRNSLELASEEKVDNKTKRIDRQKEPQGFGNEHSGNKLVQNTTPISKSRVEGLPKHLDEQNGRRMGEKERYKEVDVKWRDKQKIRDNETLGKDKEKKKEDMMKLKTENKKNEQGKLKDGGSNLGGVLRHTGTDLLKSSDNNSFNEGKIRKRENMDTNGFLHESDIRPNKVQRPAAHPLTENGRKLENFRAPSKPSHDMSVVPDVIRLNKKDKPTNGMIEVQKPFPSKPNPPAASIVSNQIAEAPKRPHDSNLNKTAKVPDVEDLIAEASRRPPHPESKYLPAVLTVPKIQDWSEDDEQDWLFRKKSSSRRPIADSAGNEDLHVWSEALPIETADVCALPYVIPY